MPFPSSVVRDVVATSKICHLCQMPFTRLDRKEVHSTTGLHLVLFEAKNGGYFYKVTDPPKGYEFMKGKILETDSFAFGFSYYGDAVCVCSGCHKLIHEFALELCRNKIPGFKGNTPLPRLLVEASYSFGLPKRKQLISRR